MWNKGNQGFRYDYSARRTNDELLKKEGFIQEGEAQVLLYQFLRNNIGYTSELFLGIKLFAFQEMLIKSMMIADTCMFVLSRGMSKTYSAAIYLLLQLMFRQGIQVGVLSSSFRQCLSPDSLCPTNRGVIAVKDLKVGDLIQSRFGLNKILNKWGNEKSQSRKIETKKGYNLEGKIGHKMLVYDKESHQNIYKNIEDLKNGDFLPVSRGGRIFGDRNPLAGFEFKSENHCSKETFFNDEDIDFYYLIGMILAEGYVSTGKNGSRTMITSGDEEVLKRIKKYLTRVMPDNNCSIIPKSGSGTYNLSICSNSFAAVLDYIGYNVENWVSYKKEIPEKMIGISQEKMAAMIRGMFDGDGGIHLYKGTANSAEVKYTTTSKVMAKQLHLLLLNFGIISKLQKNEPYKKVTKKGVEINARESWNIRITGKVNIKIYRDYINFDLNRKKDQIESLVEYWEENPIRDDLTSVPNFKSFLFDNLTKKELRLLKINESRYSSMNVSYETIKRIYETDSVPEVVKEKCGELLLENFYYDPIAIIEDSSCETIDIEVENEHCYVGNGFVNHNSKMILGKAEDILKKPGARMVAGLFKLTKGTDQWTLTCGRSKAIALPLADGSRLRGFRFQVILLDEFLNIPRNIFTEVILPFLGVVDNPTERMELRVLEDSLIERGKMTEDERYKWIDNKLILLSSPSYTFEYMYELYCSYRDKILGVETKNKEDDEENGVDEDAYRVIFQLSYECAPIDLYDKKQLNSAKTTMSEAVFQKEYGGQFVSESDSYFRLSRMAACTVPDGDSPHVEICGDPSKEYIISIDPSWSEDEGSDDFAMGVFKLDKENNKACQVHAYGMAGTNLKKHIRYFHYLITHFNVQVICLDYAGGVQFISACNESELFKSSKIHLGVIDNIENDFDKPETYQDDILKFRSELAPTQKKYCYFRKPTSQWIRQANELLQANIDHKRIWFAAPATDSAYESQRGKSIPIDEIEWDRKYRKSSTKASMIDFLDHQVSMIHLTKSQAANIEVVSNPQGSQVFRLPTHMSRLSGPNKPRKDNYSVLVLGNWMSKVYFDSMGAEDKPKVASTFTPFLA